LLAFAGKPLLPSSDWGSPPFLVGNFVASIPDGTGFELWKLKADSTVVQIAQH
jgi:hypothetical protein